MLGGSEKMRESFLSEAMFSMSEEGRRFKAGYGRRVQKVQSIHWSLQNVWKYGRCKALQTTGAIKNKTANDLHNKEFCFQPQPCWDEFQWIQTNKLWLKQCDMLTSRNGNSSKTKITKTEHFWWNRQSFQRLNHLFWQRSVSVLPSGLVRWIFI